MSNGASIRFVETLEHKRFKEFCAACQRDRYIGLCYGPPGVGKTISALRYSGWGRVLAYDDRRRSPKALAAAQSCEVVFYTPLVVNTPKQIAGSIDQLRHKLTALRLEYVRTKSEPRINELKERLDRRCERQAAPGSPIIYLRERDLSVAEKISAFEAEQRLHLLQRQLSDQLAAVSDPTTLIIIDEADRLKEAGLEQLRDIFDRHDIGIVLIGMPGIEKRLARYPQLYSRVGFVHHFRPLSPKEVRRVLEEKNLPWSFVENALQDEEVMAAILRVTGGNFRLLDRLLTQTGRILEINHLDRVTREAVEAARESLVIGTA